MRVALWTPSPEAAWVRSLSARLGAGLELEVLSSEPSKRPAVAIDLYHVGGAPAHGFVYRALLDRPGVVLLAEWGLHALVHAETVGRGDPDAYRREARRAHGDTGSFVARQVLAGLGGGLPGLVAMNQRVLDASLALVAFDAAVAARAGERLPGRSVHYLPLERATAGEKPATLAAALGSLVLQLAPRAEAARRAIAARDAEGDSLAGAALSELRWAARELGLAELPADTGRLVSALFEATR